MIDALVRTNLGTLGSAILDFYIANSLWINGLLLLAALAIILGRWNYSRFLEQLLVDFRTANAEKISANNRSHLRTALKKASLPWDEAAKSAWVPYVIPPGRIKIISKNEANMKQLFGMDTLLNKLMN